jgi:hypothetical protein
MFAHPQTKNSESSNKNKTNKKLKRKFQPREKLLE